MIVKGILARIIGVVVVIAEFTAVSISVIGVSTLKGIVPDW